MDGFRPTVLGQGARPNRSRGNRYASPARAQFRTAQLEKAAAQLAEDFQSAEPFAHVVLDDMLDADPGIVEDFPTVDWEGWNPLGDRYQKNKRACSDLELIGEPFKSLIGQCSEPRFLRVLEQVTGIDQLIPDPFLTDGGLHLSGPVAS